MQWYCQSGEDIKLARVDVGNISKKGENMEGIITWNIFTSWFFNRTLSIYGQVKISVNEFQWYSTLRKRKPEKSFSVQQETFSFISQKIQVKLKKNKIQNLNTFK